MFESLLEEFYHETEDIKAGACPEPEDLAAYCDGKLNSSRKSIVERHLVSCEECLEIVVCSSSELPEEKKQSALSRAADFVIFFAEGITHVLTNSDAFELLPGPSMDGAVLRGEQSFTEEKACFRRTVGGFTAQVEVSKIKSSGGLIRVKLCRDGEIVHERLRISLMQNNKKCSSYLAEDGVVVFEYFSYGRYVLLFSRKQESMKTMSMMIVGG